nr:hypothetical protein [uncultured Moellerella sp.]
MSAYNGVRGLGLAGSIAFGLAITMGFLSYIFLYWSICFSDFKSRTIFFIFIFCFFASMSAGRTAILGILMSILFLDKKIYNISFYIKFQKYIILTLIFFIISYYWMINVPDLTIILDRYMSYVFQAYINYTETGSFAVSSLSTLHNMYFIPDNLMTILFGDGKYTNSDGSYYMGTDGGYMRFMLYFGIIGSLIPYLSFIIFCSYIIIKTNSTNPITKKIFTGIIIIAFVSHYKAEVIFFNVGFMKVVYILGYFYLFKSFNKKTNFQNNGLS